MNESIIRGPKIVGKCAKVTKTVNVPNIKTLSDINLFRYLAVKQVNWYGYIATLGLILTDDQ